MANAAADIFASALTAPAPEKKKKGPAEVRIAANAQGANPLDLLAAADALAKTLKTVAECHGTAVKSQMADYFATEGLKLHRRPDNFKGMADHATASCQLKKRDSRRPLEPAEVEVLEAAGVKIEKVTTQEERFFFNDEILANPDLRAKVSAALSLIDFGGLNPLLKQEKVESSVACDESVEAAFANAKNEDEAKKLAAIVGTLSITPKFSGTLQDAMGVLISAGVTL